MSPRAQILQWAEQGRLADPTAALALAQITPDRDRWRTFLSRLMLATGTLLFGAGVIFFFAYNWKGLPPLVRFAIVEALLLAAFALAWIKGIATPAGRAALFLAALMTGALFALIGQTYQMGADPWPLFALWAALLLPWAFAAQKPELWLLTLLLANVTVGAYSGRFTAYALLNITAHALWEWFAPEPRFAPRLAGAATAIAFTAIGLNQVFDRFQLLGAVYLLWLPASLLLFTKFRRDLFLVAASLLSVIITITSLCARALFSGGRGDFFGSALLIAVIVVILSGAAAKWLQHLAKE